MRKIFLAAIVLVILIAVGFGVNYFIKQNDEQLMNKADVQVKAFVQIGEFDKALAVCDNMNPIRAAYKDVCYLQYYSRTMYKLMIDGGWWQNATAERKLSILEEVSRERAKACTRVVSKEVLEMCSKEISDGQVRMNLLSVELATGQNALERV